MEKIRVLIADDVSQTRKDLTRLLYFEEDMEVVGEAGDGEEALQKVLQLSPDVVLMDINMPRADGIAATEMLSRLSPRTGVVIISIHGETEYMKKAMFAGARDFLVKPLSSEEMATAIRNVFRQQRQRDSGTGGDMPNQAGCKYNGNPAPETPWPLPSASPAALPVSFQERPAAPGLEGPLQDPEVEQPRLQATKPAQEEKSLGQVTTVFSGKGGAGKTTVATNLAVVMAQSGKKKVALVDCDLQFGDIAVMLNLTDGKTVCDLVQAKSTESVVAFDDFLIRHFTGIDILIAPLLPQEAEYVQPEHIESILRILRQSYDYIIVDTAAAFHDINLQLFDLSDQILLLVTRDIAAIKNARISLNIMESLGLRDKVRLVLNRSDQDLGVEVADLEKGLEMVVSHQIPGDERAVVSSINKGVPLVINQPSSELAKSLRRMGERAMSGKRLPVPDKQGKHLISRIFSV